MNHVVTAAASTAVRLNPMHEGLTGVLPQHLPEYLLIASMAIAASFFVIPIVMAIIGSVFGISEVFDLIPDAVGGVFTVFSLIGSVGLAISGSVLIGIGTYPIPDDPATIQSSLESAYKVKIDSGTDIFQKAAKDNKGVDATDVRFMAADGMVHSGQLTRRGMDFTLYATDADGNNTPYERSGLAKAKPVNPTETTYDYGGHRSAGDTE